MAKKWAEYFLDSLETQYATSPVLLMKLANLNSAVRFTPILPTEVSETKNAGMQYAIQRAKRFKAADTAQDATKGAGDNFVARANTAQDLEWDTIETKRANKRDLIVRWAVGTENEPLDNPALFNRTMNAIVSNRLIEGEEKAIANVYKAGQNSTAASTPVIDITKNTEADRLAVLDKLFVYINNVKNLVDDFKAYDDKVIVVVHPQVGQYLARTNGITYYGAPNTFPDGLGRRFEYGGVWFFESPYINTLTPVGTNATIAGGIIMSMEAYANAGLTQKFTHFKQQLYDEMTEGHSYSELDAVIDKARIFSFDATADAEIVKSKLVNA